MRTLFGLFILVSLSSAGTATDLGNRAVSLGVTILNAKECASLAGCMETPFYEQKEIDTLKQNAVGCAMSPKVLTPIKIMQGTGMLNDFNKCLAPEDTWSSLLTKVIDIGFPLVKNTCVPMNNTLTTWKKNKKSKADCIKDGYDLIMNKVANKEYIDKVCCQIRKKLTKKQISCVLTSGQKVLKVAMYKCATTTNFC